MTPAELKKKVCPILEARSHNRKGRQLQTCIGEQCAMWAEIKVDRPGKVDGKNGVITSMEVTCALRGKLT